MSSFAEMPNLLALSFEGTLTPAFDLHCLELSRTPPDGWGIACYPGGEPAALVMKEAAPSHGSIRSALVSAWERLESSIFLVHIRTATWGAITEANTQPFQRAWGRRDWLIAHSGSLEHRLPQPTRFEPVGSTDSEQILCDLLGRAAEKDCRSLADIPAPTLLSWFHDLNRHGSLTTAFSDGLDLAVYADRRGNGEAWVWELLPPHGQLAFGDDDLTVDLTRRGIHSRKGIIVSSNPLPARKGEQGQWRRLIPGHLLIVRQGAVRAELGPEALADPDAANAPIPVAPPITGTRPPAQTHSSQAMAARPAGAPSSEPPPAFVPRARPLHVTTRAEKRRYEVLHRTVYRYANPVERSAHVLRLFPAHDRLQTLHSCELKVSVPGHEREFDDVFGNRVRRVLLETPFTELVIEARSNVELLDIEPLDFRPARVRSSLPLVWMPWQRQILQPFLLPPELPESELAELTEYAMSFAQRNDYELLDTLLDLNATIFTDYQYKQGATNLATTAFEVYANRRGVCQDFANLFICLARLIGVPARYVCGYLYTGPKSPNARMGDASHAWVQVYLPEVGWKGFDPTNGVITQTDHVRVAVGRNYVDATPTSGTLYVGGGGETLSVEVSLTKR
jgi:transglutaminase-like putative cysteine protease/predicted glutamine amidotransferase